MRLASSYPSISLPLFGQALAGANKSIHDMLKLPKTLAIANKLGFLIILMSIDAVNV